MSGMVREHYCLHTRERHMTTTGVVHHYSQFTILTFKRASTQIALAASGSHLSCSR